VRCHVLKLEYLQLLQPHWLQLCMNVGERVTHLCTATWHAALGVGQRRCWSPWRGWRTPHVAGSPGRGSGYGRISSGLGTPSAHIGTQQGITFDWL